MNYTMFDVSILTEEGFADPQHVVRAIKSVFGPMSVDIVQETDRGTFRHISVKKDYARAYPDDFLKVGGTTDE